MSTHVFMYNFFSKIRQMFLGEYQSENKLLLQMREEMLDISSIPNSSTDKFHLRNDFNMLLIDTDNALSQIKKERKNGKTT